MTETFKVLLFLYLAGYIVAFITVVLTLLRGLFFFNSIEQKNLRLVLLKITVFGETKEYEEPEAPSFRKIVKEFGWGIVIDLFISLLSWILLFSQAIHSVLNNCA